MIRDTRPYFLQTLSWTWLSRMIWIVFILMTSVAVLCVSLPLALTRRFATSKSQIAGTERACSAEWRDLDQSDAPQSGLATRLVRPYFNQPFGGTTSQFPRAIAAILATVIIPLVSWSLYLHVGHYNMPDQPLAVRIDSIPGHKDTVATIARTEAYIREHPLDGRAFEFVAPFYLRARRAQDAVQALGDAIRLLGATAARLAALGEAKVIASDGVVTDEAERDFVAALQLDKANATAHHYLRLGGHRGAGRAKASDMRPPLQDAHTLLRQ